jgi:hypothetical protein
MDDHNQQVKIQVADPRHQPLKFMDLVVQRLEIHHDADAAVECLKQNPEVLTADRIFQIVYSTTLAPILDDVAIFLRLKKRGPAAPTNTGRIPI